MAKHKHIRVWEINPTKIQGPSTSAKFLGVQWYGACRDIPSEVKNKLLYLTCPTTKNEAQHLMGQFVFWKATPIFPPKPRILLCIWILEMANIIELERSKGI